MVTGFCLSPKNSATPVGKRVGKAQEKYPSVVNSYYHAFVEDEPPSPRLFLVLFYRALVEDKPLFPRLFLLLFYHASAADGLPSLLTFCV